MRKSLFVLPLAAVIALPAAGVVSTSATSAGNVAPRAASTSAATAPSGAASALVVATSAKGKLTKKHKRLRKIHAQAESSGLSLKKVKKYHVSKKWAREIGRAHNWAHHHKERVVRNCESGGNYKTNTGNGYFGAYQFSLGTWASVGGRHYHRYPHRAPKFAQDHMAFRLYKRRGWSPWSCA